MFSKGTGHQKTYTVPFSSNEVLTIVEITEGESWVGARGWAGGGEFPLPGGQVWVLQDNRVLEAEEGDGCRTKRTCLMPLNGMLQNGYHGKFLVCVFYHNFLF